MERRDIPSSGGNSLLTGIRRFLVYGFEPRKPDDPRQDHMARRHNQKGIALVVVLTAIVILTVITTDFQYRARVNLRMSANMRDELKAEYLAHSGEAFTRLLMNLQSTIDELVNKRFKINIQLWQWVPIDSDLLRAFSGGVFAQQDMIGSIFDSYTSMFDDNDDSDSGGGMGINAMDSSVRDEASNRAAEAGEEYKEDIAEETGFGNFDGHFFVELSDEDSKLCLNATGTQELKALQAELTALFMPEELDFLFERRDEQGNYMTREETISAIIDWVDPDNIRFGMEAGDEGSRYDFMDNPYASKNAFLDSLDELQMVYGVDDRFWDIFRDAFTIYRGANSAQRQINVNTASPIVLEGMMRMCTNTNPTQEQVRGTLDQVLKYRDEETFGMGFSSGKDFEKLTNQYTQFDLTNGCLAKHTRTEATIFKAKATGEIGDVTITIEMVMDKTGKLYYWRSL